jgi:hypothetical protein
VTSAATVRQRPQTGVKPGSSFIRDRIKFHSRWAFPGARRGGDLVGYARAVMLSSRFVIVEEAAAIGKALSPLSVLSRSPLDHVVGVEVLLLGAVGASLARLRNFNEADFEGGAVNRVARSGDHGSSSRGTSP